MINYNTLPPLPPFLFMVNIPVKTLDGRVCKRAKDFFNVAQKQLCLDAFQSITNSSYWGWNP